MNTNIGEMPLEIFADYCAEITEQEWHWFQLSFYINANNLGFEFGNGPYDDENGTNQTEYHCDYTSGVGYSQYHGEGGVVGEFGHGDGNQDITHDEIITK